MKLNEWLDQYEPLTGMAIIIIFGIIGITTLLVLDALEYDMWGIVIAMIIIFIGGIIAVKRSPMLRRY
jgi:hypothetical protein